MEDMLSILMGLVFWLIMAVVIARGLIRTRKNRPGQGQHPTTINRSSSGGKPALNRSSGKGFPRPAVSSDGHTIPRSKDITCEGQYGHSHGDTGPRYIVHEEPTTGYCNLNGKIVALKDCWKY